MALLCQLCMFSRREMQVQQRESQLNRRQRSISSEELLVLKGFRAHLKAVAEPSVLDLLFLAQIRPVTNQDVREAFKVKRSGAYKRLNALKELGLLEKRDDEYRTSEYSGRLIHSTSQLFRGAMKGNFPEAAPQPTELSTLDKVRIMEVCKIVEKDSDYLYDRGVLQEEERDKRRKLASQVRAEFGNVEMAP